MRLVSFMPLRRSPAILLRRGRRRAVVVLATGLALASAVTPNVAETRRSRPPVAADPEASANSTEQALDFYFAALAAARDDASAARARGRIEAQWHRSGSDTADLLSTRAATAAHSGDRTLALDLIDAAIVVAPKWPNARLERALVHLAGHDIDRAIADLSTTLAMDPRHFGAMSVLASILETAGRKPEALKWLRRLAEIDPRNPAVAADRLEKLTVEVEGREL